MANGLSRFSAPHFTMTDAEAIHALITNGQATEADDQLRHLVHVGVAPSDLFEAAIALGQSGAA